MTEPDMQMMDWKSGIFKFCQISFSGPDSGEMDGAGCRPSGQTAAALMDSEIYSYRHTYRHTDRHKHRTIQSQKYTSTEITPRTKDGYTVYS
jgi:hypothetical protein